MIKSGVTEETSSRLFTEPCILYSDKVVMMVVVRSLNITPGRHQPSYFTMKDDVSVLSVFIYLFFIYFTMKGTRRESVVPLRHLTPSKVELESSDRKYLNFGSRNRRTNIRSTNWTNARCFTSTMEVHYS